ncbi:MAG: NAD(P)/FAD-dependent oxidoreductase [Muribaculaceae bacterium]|nr:NAD(P)/FAD-dependent oxidoreductase [Muribaculaceae bacterium]
MTEKEHIVIIGGGFAGLTLLKKLNRDKYRITIVDSTNYHSFPPLFYQIASGGLEPSGICFPLRREVKRFIPDDTRFHMGKVEEIDTTHKTVHTGLGETIHYDRLILAAGSTNNFFNMPDLEKKVYTLKSVEQAIRCRNDILTRLEEAVVTTDPEKRRRLLSFVVVGGGPTGVEIAGALGEMKRYTITREYPELCREDLRITIVEGTDRLLQAMSQKSSVKAKKYLEKLMVDTRLGVNMTSYDGQTATLSDGTLLPAGMLIWTAGVAAVPFKFTGATPRIGRGRRIETDRFNRVTDLENVYAVGDICIMTEDEKFPNGHPQVAQVAIQQADTLAYNLNHGYGKRPFHYKDKGSMATVGRNRAVVDLPRLHFGGWLAWVAWMGIHLVSILGMRNKINVLLSWTWAYFTYSQALRLIFRASRFPDRDREE